MCVSDRVDLLDQTAEAQPKAERDAEGGSRCLRPPIVVTVNPFHVCVHVDCGEASVVNMGFQLVRANWIPLDGGVEVRVDEWGEIFEERIALTDLEKALKNLAANNARARSKFRRYCKSNRLRKMWVLTYESQTLDRKQIQNDMNGFMNRWRLFNGGEPFPYAYVLELHESREGYHVHVAVPLGYMDKHVLQKMWGHGLVWFSDKKAPPRTSARKQSEILAAYLAKYLDKSFNDECRAPGEHRYEVAQGFDPDQVRREFPTMKDAREWLAKYQGESFVEVWCSDDKEEWDGRPVWLFSSG